MLSKCKDCGLSTSAGYIEDIILRVRREEKSLGESDEGVRAIEHVSRHQLQKFVSDFRTCLIKEIETKLFFYISSEKQRYYVIEEARADSFFDERALKAFPGIRYDVVHAGRCYATELDTASVFHSCRILERGLWALARKLRLRFKTGPVDYQQQKTVFLAVNKRIDELRQKAKGPKKSKELEFYSKVSAQLENFKDAYRDPISHSRAKYDASEARVMFNAAETVMVALALHGLHE